MPTISGVYDAELIRIEPCQGCRFLGTAGPFGCCNYLIITGKRRPCKGGAMCTVKAPDDPALSKKVLDYNKRHGQKKEKRERKEVDRRLAKIDPGLVRELLDRDTPIMQIVRQTGVRHSTLVAFIERQGWTYNKRVGKLPVSDEVLATVKALYDQGLPYRVIAERSGKSVRACQHYARKNGWHRDKPTGRPRKEQESTDDAE